MTPKSDLEGLTKERVRIFSRTFSGTGVNRVCDFASISVAMVGGKVTATSAAVAPYVREGDMVVITGAADAKFNGEFMVRETNGTTTFSWLGDPTSGASDTVTVQLRIKFRKLLIRPKVNQTTENTGTLYFGPSATAGANWFDLQSGIVYDYAAQVGCRENLADFYIENTASGDGVHFLIH